MKVSELIEVLSRCDPDKEIRLATQPNYPLAFHLRGVYDPDTAEPWDEDTPKDEDASKVWLVEGAQAQNPYEVPRDAFDAYEA